MGGIMELKVVLDEALRQWNDFKNDRKDCTLKDYNSFILEIYEQMKEGSFEQNLIKYTIWIALKG